MTAWAVESVKRIVAPVAPRRIPGTRPIAANEAGPAAARSTTNSSSLFYTSRNVRLTPAPRATPRRSLVVGGDAGAGPREGSAELVRADVERDRGAASHDRLQRLGSFDAAAEGVVVLVAVEAEVEVAGAAAATAAAELG